MGDGDDFNRFRIAGQSAIDQPMRLPMNFPSQCAMTTSYAGVWVLENVGNLGFDTLNKPMGILIR